VRRGDRQRPEAGRGPAPSALPPPHPAQGPAATTVAQAAPPSGAGAFGALRTDLAIESLEDATGETRRRPLRHGPASSPEGPPTAPRRAAEGRTPPPRGVRIEEEHEDGVELSRVHILTAEGERLVGKPRGTYVTLDAPDLRRRNTQVQERVARLLARELGALLHLTDDSKVFVVGLGNWNATPDALGPKVVSELLVTRHLSAQVPEDLRGQMRSVAALAPGVLGLTGIETGEIIRGIVDRIRPDVVIAVDALATRSTERILRTIQIADTGIHPGSGVGNHRAGVSRETLGVPVVAVGVPTVVHAATIAADTLELLAEHFRDDPAYAGLRRLAAEDKRRLIAEALAPAIGDLMVTPKEIDVLIDDMAKVIAAGINAAVHPKVAAQELLLD
jgi:spore protease